MACVDELYRAVRTGKLPLGFRGWLSGYPLVSHQLTGKMSMDSTCTMHSGTGFFEPESDTARDEEVPSSVRPIACFI